MIQEETLDEILGGRLKIRQSKTGYRFNLDSLILAHFVTCRPQSVNLDLGCGNGILALVLAARFVQSRWRGLELQAGLGALARKNVEENGLAARVTIDIGDARNIQKIYAPHTFDAVVFNPPYRKIHSGRINPLPEKAIARHEVSGSLAGFLAAAVYALKPKGRVFAVYPATRLAELMRRFDKKGIEPKRLKPVFSDDTTDAEFVLVEGRQGAREELKMEPPLYVYDAPKKYSPSMERIFADLASPAG